MPSTARSNARVTRADLLDILHVEVYTIYRLKYVELIMKRMIMVRPIGVTKIIRL